MDETRQLRFLIPPFFTFGSLALGAYLGHTLPNLSCYSTEKLISIAAALTASSIPLGFFITSASILLLRLIFRPFGNGPYEAHLSLPTRGRIWPKLGSELPPDQKWNLYAAATFDHELFAHGINRWIQRRWTIFNLSVHCITSVMLAHIVALFLPFQEKPRWFCFSAVLIFVFLITAVIAWVETMRMIEFQAYRRPSSNSTSGNPSSC